MSFLQHLTIKLERGAPADSLRIFDDRSEARFYRRQLTQLGYTAKCVARDIKAGNHRITVHVVIAWKREV